MIEFVRAAAVVMAAVVSCWSAAAAADAGAALRDEVLAAMEGTTSFAVDMTNPDGIFGNAIVLPKAGEAKVQGSAGPQTLLAYIVAGQVLAQINGGAWQRQPLPANAEIFVPLQQSATVTPLADQVDHGQTFGAFSAVTALVIPVVGTIPNVTVQCTFDKSTMLLHACSSQYATFAFHGYNDPKNAVDLPDDAKNAAQQGR